MEPLKPQDKAAALASPALAAPGPAGTTPEYLLEEYERLLSERFVVDPDGPQPAPLPGQKDREERLRELHALLFPVPMTP